MALLKCKECGNLVSTQAKTCPQCGVKAPTEETLLFKRVLSVLCIGFLGFLVYSCAHTPDTSTPEEKAAKDIDRVIHEVAYACAASIEEVLSDPDSAKFDYDHINAVPKFEKDTAYWVVTIPVRAKNRFNATVLGVFQCKVRGKGQDKDDWEALSVVQIE